MEIALEKLEIIRPDNLTAARAAATFQSHFSTVTKALSGRIIVLTLSSAFTFLCRRPSRLFRTRAPKNELLNYV